MDISPELFYIFSIILLIAAFRVITAKNAVHSALFLILVFFQMAAIWMLLKAEFLSVVLVLVYVGAVMVLFLFVVMMLDVDMASMRKGFWKNFPLACVLFVIVALEICLVFYNSFQDVKVVNVAPTLWQGHELSNTQVLGVLLYTHYLYAVEVAAAILTVSVVAAISLTIRGRKDTKHISPGLQVRVFSKDRLRVIKVETSQPEVEVKTQETPEVKVEDTKK